LALLASDAAGGGEDRQEKKSNEGEKGERGGLRALSRAGYLYITTQDAHEETGGKKKTIIKEEMGQGVEGDEEQITHTIKPKRVVLAGRGVSQPPFSKFKGVPT